MSKQRNKIREGLKEFMSSDLVFPATVKSIDEDACTIDVVTAEGMDIFEVKLRAVKTEKYGCVVFPKKDTTVQICRISDDNDFLMLHADEVEKIYWKIEDMTKEVTKDGFIYNGGDNDGIVKVNPLTDDINSIKDDINMLKNIFKTAWIVAPQDGGAALKAAAASWAAQQLQQTNKSDLENTKIKH